MTGFGKLRRHRIGSLRHIVRLQKRERTSDDDRGRPIYTWVDVVSDMPAAIKTLSGTEAELARQLVANATVRIEMRADSRITPQMRILHGEREFYIGHVEDVQELGRWMVLTCAEAEL